MNATATPSLNGSTYVPSSNGHHVAPPVVNRQASPPASLPDSSDQAAAVPPPRGLIPGLMVFWAVVLGAAAFGSVTGAQVKLGMAWQMAILPVFALELGGVLLSAHADWRREMGEQATPSRVLSAAVAIAAFAWNLVSHWDTNPVFAGAFSFMSALGYSTYLVRSAAKRRDALRKKGKLEPTPPAYGTWRRLRHPRATRRALDMFRRDPSLGLLGSLDAVEADDKMTAYLRLRLLQDNTPEQADGILLALDPKTILPLLRERMHEYRLGLVDAMASEMSAKNVLGAARSPRQKLTAPRLDARELANEARRNNRATKPPSGRPSKPADHSPLAIADAATIRTRYPDGLPDPGGQRLVRADLGWHPTKATNAVNAYRAAADLTSPNGTPA